MNKYDIAIAIYNRNLFNPNAIHELKKIHHLENTIQHIHRPVKP